MIGPVIDTTEAKVWLSMQDFIHRSFTQSTGVPLTCHASMPSKNITLFILSG
jgi:hypothetical protein